MLGKNEENKALRQAETLSLDDVEKVLLGGSIDSGPKENGIGSYERFMSMVGALEVRGRLM